MGPSAVPCAVRAVGRFPPHPCGFLGAGARATSLCPLVNPLIPRPLTGETLWLCRVVHGPPLWLLADLCAVRSCMGRLVTWPWVVSCAHRVVASRRRCFAALRAIWSSLLPLGCCSLSWLAAPPSRRYRVGCPVGRTSARGGGWVVPGEREGLTGPQAACRGRRRAGRCLVDRRRSRFARRRPGALRDGAALGVDRRGWSSGWLALICRTVVRRGGRSLLGPAWSSSRRIRSTRRLMRCCAARRSSRACGGSSAAGLIRGPGRSGCCSTATSKAGCATR